LEDLPVVFLWMLLADVPTTVLLYRLGLLFSKFVKDHYRNAP
jgi:hypothetical protein